MILLMVVNAKSGIICYWRASEAIETVLGVDNAKSGICERVWEKGPYGAKIEIEI